MADVHNLSTPLLPAPVEDLGIVSDSVWNSSFFERYEADIAAASAGMRRADWVVYSLIGAFFAVLALLALYVMFSFPNSGEF